MPKLIGPATSLTLTGNPRPGMRSSAERRSLPTETRARGAPYGEAMDASMVPQTEEEWAEVLRRQGAKLVRHRGRWWRRGAYGIFTGVHLAARFTADEATWPTRAALAFRAPLTIDSASHANATMPAHILTDLKAFDPASLSSGRRYHHRRCRRDVEIVEVRDASALAGDGFNVYLSALERTQNPYQSVWDRDTFVANRRPWIESSHRVMLAGLHDGRMVAFMCASSIGSTAYVDWLDISTDALKSHVSTCLHMDLIELCRRTSSITEIVHSLHLPETPALGTFKEGIGFPVVRVPSRTSFVAPFGMVVRRFRPFTHYRLTGRANAVTRAAEVGDAKG